ncbi:MAG TPA: hypothetical protein VE959_14585 [Bryobacteraceae bacterium]|nr:hypothetical protein [Bryobacteraceae bacterium]
MTSTTVRSLSPAAARWRQPAAVAFLLAWFGYFSWDALLVHFAPDDIMNLDYYWNIKPGQLLLLQFMPWRGPYRPMAGLFYRGMLHFFGLNPVPYHAVVLLVLLANVYLVYRLARVLWAGELAACLASLIVCYHAGLHMLYYDTAFVFDVLCCFFYLAAFVYYARIRGSGRLLDPREAAVHLGLYLCALNSKEMAITLPVALLAYEWFYHKPSWSGRGVAEWLSGPGRVILLGAVLDLAFLYGSLLRPNALVVQPGYKPALSFARFMEFYSHAYSDLFEQGSGNDFAWGAVLTIWFVLTYLAWRRDRPILRFCWVFWLVTPMPLSVLAGRRGACLAIPFSCLAVFAPVVFLDVVHTGARFLARERAFRRFGDRNCFAALCVLGVALWGWQNDCAKRLYVKSSMESLGELTWLVMGQLRQLNPHVKPHSTVVFLDDPFDAFDMAQIAELWFRDHSLNIKLLRKTPMTPLELSKADYLFTFKNGPLMQLK